MKLTNKERTALTRKIKRGAISPEDLIEHVYTTPGFKEWFLKRKTRARQCGS